MSKKYQLIQKILEVRMKNTKLNLAFGLLSIVSTLSFGAQPGDKRARDAADQGVATDAQEASKRQRVGTNEARASSSAISSLKWSNGKPVKILHELKHFSEQKMDFGVNIFAMATSIKNTSSLQNLLEKQRAILHNLGIRVQILPYYGTLKPYMKDLRSDSDRTIQHNLKTMQNIEKQVKKLLDRRHAELNLVNDFKAESDKANEGKSAGSRLTSVITPEHQQEFLVAQQETLQLLAERFKANGDKLALGSGDLHQHEIDYF